MDSSRPPVSEEDSSDQHLERPGFLMELLLGVVKVFAKEKLLPLTIDNVLSKADAVSLQDNLNFIIEGYHPDRWIEHQNEAANEIYYELTLHKRAGLNAKTIADVLQTQFSLHNIPYIRIKQQFKIFSGVALSVELAKEIHLAIPAAYKNKKLQQGLESSEEKKDEFNIYTAEVQGTLEKEKWVLLTTNDKPSQDFQSNRSHGPTFFSPSHAKNEMKSDLLSPSENSHAKARVAHNKKSHKKPIAENVLTLSQRKNHSPHAEASTPSPEPHHSIEWTVNGENIVYDRDHPEVSRDIHPIRGSGRGKQFLLFNLKPDDFSDRDSYEAMKAIADNPAPARKQGDQGVVFLGEQKVPPISEMTQKQRLRYDVKTGNDGNEFVPSVKLKMLGVKGRGDIRSYGFSIKNENNDVLNVVTALDEEAHKADKRRRGG
jgi:hypothetical protein